MERRWSTMVQVFSGGVEMIEIAVHLISRRKVVFSWTGVSKLFVDELGQDRLQALLHGEIHPALAGFNTASTGRELDIANKLPVELLLLSVGFHGGQIVRVKNNPQEIGRASCRERVCITTMGVSMK